MGFFVSRRGSNAQVFWSRVFNYPPILLRLLARPPKGKPFTTSELSARSGLPPVTIEAISHQTDWTGIDVPTAHAFMRACNTDLADRNHCRRIYMYLKTQPRTPLKRFSYLRRSPQWKPYYLPLIERYVEYLINNGKSSTNTTLRGDSQKK